MYSKKIQRLLALFFFVILHSACNSIKALAWPELRCSETTINVLVSDLKFCIEKALIDEIALFEGSNTSASSSAILQVSYKNKYLTIYRAEEAALAEHVTDKLNISVKKFFEELLNKHSSFPNIDNYRSAFRVNLKLNNRIFHRNGSIAFSVIRIDEPSSIYILTDNVYFAYHIMGRFSASQAADILSKIDL